MSRRRCHLDCPCICHDTGGSAHDHNGRACPGKTLEGVALFVWLTTRREPVADLSSLGNVPMAMMIETRPQDWAPAARAILEARHGITDDDMRWKH